MNACAYCGNAAPPHANGGCYSCGAPRGVSGPGDGVVVNTNLIFGFKHCRCVEDAVRVVNDANGVAHLVVNPLTVDPDSLRELRRGHG